MIKLYKPTLKRKDMDAVLNSMVDEAISPGERNSEFLSLLRTRFSAVGGVLLRSYVKSLETACKILNLGSQSKVVISPLSPAWYMEVLQQIGCEILFADVDPYHGCISADAVKELIPRNLSAIIIHTPFGNLPDYKKFSQFTLPIILDLTQSIGTVKIEENQLENLSITIMGFEENSVITTGGGAAVLVNERKYIKPLETMFGKSGNLEKMPDMNAALGIVQLKAMQSMLDRRHEYLELFRNALMKTRHRLLLEDNDSIKVNGFTFPVLLDSRIQEVSKFTKRYKIETQNPFAECAVDLADIDAAQFVNSIPLRLRTLLFPLYPLLSKDQLKTLVKVLSTLP